MRDMKITASGLVWPRKSKKTRILEMSSFGNPGVLPQHSCNLIDGQEAWEPRLVGIQGMSKFHANKIAENQGLTTHACFKSNFWRPWPISNLVCGSPLDPKNKRTPDPVQEFLFVIIGNIYIFPVLSPRLEKDFFLIIKEKRKALI